MARPQDRPGANAALFPPPILYMEAEYMGKRKNKKSRSKTDKLEKELTLFGKLVAKLIYLLKLIKTLFLNIFTKTK